MGMQDADQVHDVIVVEDGKVTQVTRHTTDGGQIQLLEGRGFEVDYRSTGRVQTADTKSDMERRELQEQQAGDDVDTDDEDETPVSTPKKK